jgi:TRAP-type C4-dicarboxylate transport system substrate-binding protein
MHTAKRWVSLPGLAVAMLALAVACAPAAPASPTAAPAKPAEAKPAATAAPAKPAEAKPAPTTAPAKAEAKPAASPAAAAKPAEAKPAASPAAKGPVGPPVTLNAVTGWFKEYVFNDGLWDLQTRIEQKSGGSIKINWRGGPEVTPAFEQIGPVKNGVFDLLNTSGAYYTQQVPEAVLLDYLDGPIADLRKAGVFELFDQVNQQKGGVKLLGLTTGGTPYHLWTKKPIQKLDDFKGLKLRGTPTYIPLIEGVGSSPVVVPASDIYAALERGVVDGFAWPRMGVAEQKLYEVTCCVVDPGFWTVRTVLLMNVNSWNKLTPEQQKLLDETVQEIEAEWTKKHSERSASEVDELVKKYNMQVIRFPEDQARKYREIAYNEPWKAWNPKMPDFSPKVQELAQKVSPAWPPMDYHRIK